LQSPSRDLALDRGGGPARVLTPDALPKKLFRDGDELEGLPQA
jgi:hypothetical protein